MMAVQIGLSGNPMALRATVYKVELNVSDLDRHVFEAQSLALARHPSETEERLMVRLLAYALHLGGGLAFGRGISNEDEAAIWQRDLTGRLLLWIEVGLPDERALRRACGKAEAVVLYTYGGRTAAQWWAQNGEALQRLDNLQVIDLPQPFTQALAALASRNLQVQVTVQDGEVWVSVGEQTLNTRPDVRKPAGAA
jgi:uncharacterized protein YaeQ